MNAGETVRDLKRRNKEQAAVIEAMRKKFQADIELLRRDAERYRWLCFAPYGCDPLPFQLLDQFGTEKSHIDEAIDAAMAKTHNAGDHAAPAGGRVD